MTYYKIYFLNKKRSMLEDVLDGCNSFKDAKQWVKQYEDEQPELLDCGQYLIERVN